MAWHLQITGIVQSVGFRPRVKNIADQLSIHGYVRNLGNEGVEILIDDSEQRVQEFVNTLQEHKPELAEIFTIKRKIINSQHYYDFQILSSQATSSTTGFSPLPPDIAICDDCIKDLYNRHSQRYDYPFISCTNCGPRYSAIIKFPYDRENTAFRDFPLCATCYEEYTTPSDRRFHAQTTCCSNCGPHYKLLEKGNYIQQVTESIHWKMLVTEINAGKIVYMMGQGGAHFVANALNSSAVERLRKSKRKESMKPFAVMMKSMEVVEKYCNVTAEDCRLLQSSRRPIVILPIKDASALPYEYISPGLDTLGVVLPYSSLHFLLFKYNAAEVLILTSANKPGIPMPITASIDPNDWPQADFFLLHNREIVQRVDDSVVRSLGTQHPIIRRARGYTPQPIFHEELKELEMSIALGGSEVNTGAILSNGWATATQHIGTLKNVETLKFLNIAMDHLIDLYALQPKNILVDLHPTFLNRNLVPYYQQRFKDIQLYEVQHHKAHAYSLILDSGGSFNDSYLIWSVDGYGYGDDGMAWGTELFRIQQGEVSRVSSTQAINYFGGDINTTYPGRMLLSLLLHADIEPDKLLLNRAEQLFPQGNTEYQYLKRKFAEQPTMTTTSVARIMDAIAALLDITTRKSYRGEPAIRLEAVANQSKHMYDEVFVDRSDLQTDELIQAVIKMSNVASAADVAAFTHDSVANSLAELAKTHADQHSIDNIGFTGGVAYNRRIANRLTQNLTEYNFLTHKSIPPGDGGISYGQIAYLFHKLR